jgi:gamma-glutamylcyclotransferase (GGCT)/AIG2-like uncharacterized protein YtfP
MNRLPMNVEPSPARQECIAFYGTLLRDEGIQQRLGAGVMLDPIGPCFIAGNLFDLGDFPGLVPGDGRVVGELYELLNGEALAILDEYEGFVTDAPGCTLYTRRRVRLLQPEIDAWVYFYNGDTFRRPKIEGGSWSQYRKHLT